MYKISLWEWECLQQYFKHPKYLKYFKYQVSQAKNECYVTSIYKFITLAMYKNLLVGVSEVTVKMEPRFVSDSCYEKLRNKCNLKLINMYFS